MKKKIVQKGARHTALRVLTRVEAGDAYSDIVLNSELGELEGPDRALATELVYGVLRWRIKIDWIVNSFSKIKTKKLEHRVLNALRLGVYQLLFLTRVPPSAAVDESVKLVRLEGQKKAGFVNAVLRMVASGREGIVFPVLKREPIKYISVVFSHPEWLVERWIKNCGIKDAIALCQANLKVPPVVLRTNTLKLTRGELQAQLASEGFSTTETEFCPDALRVVEKRGGGEEGKGGGAGGGGRLDPIDPRYYIQDEASQLITLLLSPRPGETVLDACAAPGGKTTHMAQMMENKGAIYALDKNAARLKTLDALAKRLGVDIVRTVQADASTLACQPSLLPYEGAAGGGAGGSLSAEALPEGGFDAVLVDAPCSGLGVVRRRPDIKWRRSAAKIKELSGLQARLLDNLAKYVKEGGRMVYSVCSLEPEETDRVVDGFLDTHRGFSVEDGSKYLPPARRPLSACRPLAVGDGRMRTFPHTHGTDGFFAVRLKRG
ncbi:MAG: 16S rRNA (cytosine(967)-C(5))-methyltransferase RsmB [Thermodesulfobacteriota bacterium]